MGIIDKITEKQNKELFIKENIKKVYKDSNRPWVIGYSGGKDSTVVTQLIYEALIELHLEKYPLKNKVYIISSDTMVENPLVGNSIQASIDSINNAAQKDGISACLSAQMVYPSIEQTFWVNIFGRGYPVPNQTFRWCTDRLKITPANQFIIDKASTFGEVIVVIGVRKGESSSRDIIIKKNEIEGNLLMRHTSLANAYTFAPIMEFDVNDVWNYLLNNTSPWGDESTNQNLYQMYSDSTDGECPLIIDEATKNSAGSCGNSRFGCWTCTVVSVDKSLTGFIKTGKEPWLKELLDYRNKLAWGRDNRNNRSKIRNNGSFYFVDLKTDETNVIIPAKNDRKKSLINIKVLNNTDFVTDDNDLKYKLVEEVNLMQYLKDNKVDLKNTLDYEIIIKRNDGNYSWFGLGPYTIDYRLSMLKELIQIEKKVNQELITIDEIMQIASLLNSKEPIEMYNEIHDNLINDKIIDESIVFTPDDMKLLEDICSNNGVDNELLTDLINLEIKNRGVKTRYKINDKVKSILESDRTYLTPMEAEYED
jgi:DNA sulfur modification protein DndC